MGDPIKPELLQCGGVRLARIYCKKCDEYQLVKTNIKLCPDCRTRFDRDGDITLRKIGHISKRVNISREYKEFLIDKQNGLCYWCDRKLGFFYMRNGVVKKSSNHADHIIPYSYLQANPEDNWAIACNLCNLFKSNKYYDNQQDIRDYLKARWLIERIEIFYDKEA